ncbi:MFS transporter [Saccharomonospora halophila]|uniref:MFS transporter n=1 Tax=Saccharomonospora halophila TaxID=129922 RepID=UPI0003A6C5FD|nr:MFS transporter [Saccharomonospora halophila]
MMNSVPVEPVATSSRQRAMILITVGLALMTVVSAVSGLNVALPELARDTGASQTELTWIVDAYTVVFAGLLLLAGAVGDRFGRRGILIVGLFIFGVAAATATFTTDPQNLIALRAFMGLGAAGIMPTTLSVITTSFPPQERPRAIGVWVGIAGAGAVVGLFATGALLEFFSWNSFFWLNVMLAGLGALGTLAFVPGSREESASPLDVVGGVLSLVGVAGLVFGIIESAERGWGDPVTATGLSVGIVGILGFLAWEWHSPAPLLDPRLFRLRGFSAGSLSITVQFFAMFGFFFVVLQYLQFVAGYSPLEAAVRLLPLPLVLIPTARRAPVIAERLGFRLMGFVGLTLLGGGLLIMSTLQHHLEYGVLVAGLVIFAAGAGIAGTPATTAITASLPRTKQGVASAVNDTARELGSAIGIAILGAAMTSSYRDGIAGLTADLPAPAAQALNASVAATRSPQITGLGERGRQIATAAQQAFVDGTAQAMVIAAVIVFLAGLAVLVLAPPARSEEHC